MLTLFLALALAVLPVAASASPDGGDAETPDPEAADLTLLQRLDALVERVQIEQRNVETLEAEFVQEKSSEFLAATEVSSGTVSYASPDSVRWEYRSPKPISLVIRNDEMLTWYRDVGRAERVKVGRLSSQVLRYMNASGSLEALMGHFRATAAFPKDDREPFRIDLKPRFARVAKRLSSMTLWIDRSLYLPIRVRYQEPSGDVTEYRLEQVRVNEPVAAQRFELDLPVDVEVREIDLEGGRADLAGGR
jgi:outer membrane lipoprotein carrier protein